METQITGQLAPVLTVSLGHGESVIAESGELSWMGGDMALETGRSIGMNQKGCLFEATCSLNLTTVPGIRNKLFGGDGLFLAQLTGPGEVWLQSIALAGLAHALQPYIVTETVAEGGAAAVIGSLLKG